MMCHTSFSLFQIKAKLEYHVFLTILHKFSKHCFPIPFSALNSEELDSFWYPKVRLAAKNIQFLQKTYVNKLPFFTLFVYAGA